MKKKLVLAIAALSLFACGGTSASNDGPVASSETPATSVAQQASSSEAPALASSITIELNSITGLKALVDAGTTYLTEETSFTVNDIAWTASTGVGGATEQYNDGLYSLGCMQFKKGQAGYITNTTEIKGASKITLTWYATYDSEDAVYIPKVYQGTATNPATEVTPKEAAPQTGTDTGKTNGEKNYSVYSYTTTYELTSSNSFFKIASGQSANYISKIVIE